jgi:tRNA pseudouridine38-40 synthase
LQTLKLILEYDGTEFHGWQVQPQVRTVQGILEEKLAIILGGPVGVVGAGRTDAGVHARGQVAHCHTESDLEAERVQRGVNGLLPPDVAARSVELVSAEFHARYGAINKTYSYTILTGASRSPLLRRFAYHVRHPVDIEAMRHAAALLEGHHDFSAFWGGGDDGRNPWRTLKRLHLYEDSGVLHVIAEAESFLRHMVRNLVGTLLEVGRGRYPASWVQEVLESRNRCHAGPTIPAHGLCLEEVRYAEPGHSEHTSAAMHRSATNP